MSSKIAINLPGCDGFFKKKNRYFDPGKMSFLKKIFLGTIFRQDESAFYFERSHPAFFTSINHANHILCLYRLAGEYWQWTIVVFFSSDSSISAVLVELHDSSTAVCREYLNGPAPGAGCTCHVADKYCCSRLAQDSAR